MNSIFIDYNNRINFIKWNKFPFRAGSDFDGIPPRCAAFILSTELNKLAFWVQNSLEGSNGLLEILLSVPSFSMYQE